MSISLRKFIRKTILEGRRNHVRAGVSDSEDGKSDSPVKLDINDRGRSADQRAIGGIKGKYGGVRDLTKEEQTDHMITHKPEYKNSQITRTVIKRWWNDRVYGNSVRREYFNNPDKIRCIHWLGFYHEDPQHAIDKINMYLNPQRKREPELSTIGYTVEKAIWRYDKTIGIEYRKRSITFAYEWDLHTEFVSSATPLIHELHRGSGVHKRPNTHLNINNVIFDERDVNRRNLERINECIIDNYDNSPENVIIHVNPDLPNEVKDKIENIIKSYSDNYIIKYG